MAATKFNPYDWIPRQEKLQHFRPIPQIKSALEIENDIDIIVSRIESYKIDITMSYKYWYSIGFALIDALGENGRGYFHRISRFHPDYDFQECNNQFDRCLKSRKSGIVINTFFYLAKNAGININVNKHQISR